MGNNVSRTKVALGYALLLAALVLSLLLVRREMETLMQAEDHDVQWADSLLGLVREKDENTLSLLRTLSRAQKGLVSVAELESLLTVRDTVVIRQPRVQHRIVTRQDTIVTPTRRKGFFRRLGEAFSPPKADTAIRVQTSTEYTIDTIPYIYSDTLVHRDDTLQQQLLAAARRQEEANALAQRQRRALQTIDRRLTARIDTLVRQYEQNTLARAQAEARRQALARQHSARIIAGIAATSTVLAAIFLALIGRDITRSNRYRRELEQARRRAEDLLATRERMMLDITHDFKAPLGSIIGYADLLSRLTVDERQRFYLDNMKTSSQHLLRLVTDLLDFHRLDLHKAEVHRVAFQPARLLDEIRVSFQPLADAKGLALACDIAPTLESAYISDPLRLRQIISNLLSNAIKFTDRGTITLSADYVERRLVLSVADTGRGMPPADRERIFQEFTRLPGAQGKEGFGLGLSIVRMLVRLLEGDIQVDSVPGQGSTFTVRIPIYPVATRAKAAAEATPAHESADATPATATTALHVLLIDDDRIQLQLTTAMLAQSGLNATPCLQVDELLDALRHSAFDVLLTDVQMPAINGFDLLRLLRASNIPQAQAIPVIAVTARSDMQREDFTAHGFSGCLHKPFTVQELLTEISKEKPGSPSLSLTNEHTQPATPQPQATRYNFAALTEFSGNDHEASNTIMESFITETRQNALQLQKCMEENNINGASAIAHKMLPLFRLINATQLVTLLQTIEQTQTNTYSEQLKQASQSSLTLIETILADATRFLHAKH